MSRFPGYTPLRRSAVLLALLVPAFAQTSTTQFSGTVSDSTGAVVPGANVVATNEATGLKYTLATTDAGLFAFPSIPVGSYSLVVEKTGFKKFQLAKIVFKIVFKII